MLKRFSVALAALFVLASSAFGAGTLPGFSLSQQMGRDGRPLAGCILKFYQAGTVATPQTAYQDSGLTIPVSGGAQMTCDAFGRIGQFFLADGSIKILLTDVNGVTQVTADGLLVIGASSGGGGGSPVDPTTILTTGDVKVTYGTGVVTGFVRANGRTIGSATSGATERANSDVQALFLYLWGVDASLVVSGGRGASAAADYAANKTIVLPDARGRVLAGLNDMGNSNAGIVNPLPAAVQKGDTVTLGSLIGLGTPHTLVTANLPPYTPAGSVSGSITGTASSGQVTTNGLGGGASAVVAPTYINGSADGRSLGVTGTFAGSITGGTPQGGTSTSFDVNPAMMLITLYIKL